ncbi:hypothetical protein [Nocardioides sp.]|uniref:hypothetical protein n=1 Tax=Nocardioides sp. TaxID=35761 RepID=UPI003785292A
MRRSKLRQFAAICPGERQHALCEVYPGGVLYTQRLLRGPADRGSFVLLEDHRRDRALGRIPLDADAGADDARPRAAVALLSELTASPPSDPGPLWQPSRRAPAMRVRSWDEPRATLHLRCCCHVLLSTSWVQEQLDQGNPRAVVPSSMLTRDEDAPSNMRRAELDDLDDDLDDDLMRRLSNPGYRFGSRPDPNGDTPTL